MSKVQTENVEGDVGAREVGDVHPSWLLENPNAVVFGTADNQATIYACGVAVALLYGDMGRYEAEVESAEPPFRGLLYRFTSLQWTHHAALLRLQGVNVSDVLGPSVCIIKGEHRPVFDPCPGMDEVYLVTPNVNPTGLSIQQIFQLVKGLGF